MNILTRDIVNSRIYHGIEKEVMDIHLPLFYDKIKTLARQHIDKPLPEDWQFKGIFKKNLMTDYELAKPLIEKKKQKWHDFEITDKHVDFLNSLNDFLIQTEEEIVTRAKAELPILETKVKDEGNTSLDYEYFVEISYGTEASNGDYVYKVDHPLNSQNLKNNYWGFLCDSEDWRENG